MGDAVQAFRDLYADLVTKYAGRWVVLVKNKVIFVDKSFDLAFQRYLKVRDDPDSKMTLIDDGEGSFYDLTISCRAFGTKDRSF